MHCVYIYFNRYVDVFMQFMGFNSLVLFDLFNK